MVSSDRRMPTWKYVATTVIGVLITITILLYASTRQDIGSLQNDKLDKSEYYKDFKETQDRLKKIDDIYELLLSDRRILKKHREATEN